MYIGKDCEKWNTCSRQSHSTLMFHFFHDNIPINYINAHVSKIVHWGKYLKHENLKR